MSVVQDRLVGHDEAGVWCRIVARVVVSRQVRKVRRGDVQTDPVTRLKTFAAYPRSIAYSYAFPGSISDGADFDPCAEARPDDAIEHVVGKPVWDGRPRAWPMKSVSRAVGLAPRTSRSPAQSQAKSFARAARSCRRAHRHAAQRPIGPGRPSRSSGAQARGSRDRRRATAPASSGRRRTCHRDRRRAYRDRARRRPAAELARPPLRRLNSIFWVPGSGNVSAVTQNPWPFVPVSGGTCTKS